MPIRDPSNDTSSGPFGILKERRRWLITAWFCAGLLFIYFDSAIQPYLTSLGNQHIIRTIAEYWQDIGSTAGILCFLIGGLLTVRGDRGHTLITFILAISAAGAAVESMKQLIGRARPDAVHDQTHFYGPFGWFYHGSPIQLDSMPSGHTTAAFAMAAALSYRWPKWTLFWFLLATGVGIARTLVDRHFPSDVLIASCLGSAIGWTVSHWRNASRKEAVPPAS